LAASARSSLNAYISETAAVSAKMVVYKKMRKKSGESNGTGFADR